MKSPWLVIAKPGFREEGRSRYLAVRFEMLSAVWCNRDATSAPIEGDLLFNEVGVVFLNWDA